MALELPATVPLPRPPSVDGDALLYSGDELASALRLSRKTVTRLDQSGKLPRSLTIGGRKRWVRSEINAWVAAGGPPRKLWEATRR
jgi:predicted DNA-binding transcriptional regulator AlpA